MPQAKSTWGDMEEGHTVFEEGKAFERSPSNTTQSSP